MTLPEEDRRSRAGVARLERARQRAPQDRERGAALAEFALLAFLLWLLLAGVLELGRAFFVQNILQNAASAAARDLSLKDLPAAATFGGAGRNAIFDERFLVADAGQLAGCSPPGSSLELSYPGVRAYMEEQGAPVLNRLLLPLFIRDVVDGVTVLRYPGAALRRQDATGACDDGSAYTVRIPELRDDGSVGWREVVEPLAIEGTGDSFPLSAGGWASLRVLYPFQSVGFQGFRIDPERGQQMIDAVDPVGAAPPDDLSFVTTPASGAYAGNLGLGVLYAMDREVRPYRRVLAASAAFRREVFLP